MGIIVNLSCGKGEVKVMNTMTTTKDIPKIYVFDEIRRCMQAKYNGKLKFISSKGQNWSFYFHLGHIVWATNENHPYRRWRKYINQNCPHIDPSKVRLTPQSRSNDCADYCWLKGLYSDQILRTEQMNKIVINAIVEIIFDLAYHVNYSSLAWERDHGTVLEAPVTSTSATMSIEHLKQCCHYFSDDWFNNIYPLLTPIFYKLNISSEMFLIGRFMICIFD